MGSCGGCDNLPAKIPQFFKIILESTMQEKKLGIPRKFVKEYGNDLPECVTLEVPDGALWQIKLAKTQDGQVWMEQGWLDFANHYSLSHGKFLVFNPRGFSKFLVVIFGVTGMEIKYAPLITSGSKSRVDRENELVKNPCKRQRANSCGTCESSSSVDTESGSVKLKKARTDANLDVLPREFEGGCTSSTRRYQSKHGRRMKRFFTSKEKANLLKICGPFQSSKPCFKVLIQPSAVYRRNKDTTLEVTVKFSQKNLSQRNGNIILQNKKGRTWSVNYRKEGIKGKSRLRTKLAQGWKEFSIDNKLEVGDVCLFELITGADMTFNVIIFRGKKRGDMSSIHQPEDGRTKQSLNSKQKAKLLGKGQAFKFAEPYFEVTMQSSSVHRENQIAAANIPEEFAKKYLSLANDKGDVIIYDVNGRTWSVSYHCSESRDTSQVRFITGWKEFATENNLRVGDVCVFEMDDCKTITFKVTIFKIDAANCFSSPGKSACLENGKSAGDDIANMRSCPLLYKEVNQSTKFQDRAKEVMTTYPWFEVEMKKSYVHGSYLAIPKSFARNYIKTGASTTKLNVEDKSWLVNLFSCQHCTAKISCGWIAFAKENALKPKDICKFELISLNDCTFRVSISRNTSDSTNSAGLENVKSSGGDITDRRSSLKLRDESNNSTKVKNEADEFTRTYPWFAVEMEDAFIKGWCLNLPSSFARNYIKTGASTIKLNIGDKSWRVNLFKNRDGVCKISAGWHSFVRENTLEPKDICQFELIRRKDCFFRVSIARNTSNSD